MVVVDRNVLELVDLIYISVLTISSFCALLQILELSTRNELKLNVFFSLVAKISSTSSCTRKNCEHGACVNQEDGRASCLCEPGYSGANCNRGTCAHKFLSNSSLDLCVAP